MQIWTFGWAVMLAKKPLFSVQREEALFRIFLMLTFPHYLLQRIQLWCSIHVSEQHSVCILCPTMRAKCLVPLIILRFDRQINILWRGKYEAAHYVVSSGLSLPLSCTFKHSSQHAALRHRQCLRTMSF